MIPDRNQLDAWNTRQQAARDEYARVPIASAAVCEVCGLMSRTSICDLCQRGEIPTGGRVRRCRECDKKTWAAVGICRQCQTEGRQ